MDASLRRRLSGLCLLKFGVPFVELLCEGLLLSGGVPGGPPQGFKGPLAPLYIALCRGYPGGVFLLCPLSVTEGGLQGGDLLLLLFIHGIQGGPLGREGLHAVSVSAKFALHERKARLERGQFGITSGDRLFILGLTLDGEFCRDCPCHARRLLSMAIINFLLDITIFSGDNFHCEMRRFSQYKK